MQFLAGRIADMEHSRALERELAAARARALALERELAEAKRELAALSAPTRSERRDFLRKDE
ncbi:MAG: hypothetical protein LBD82_07095 [Deltaproteobacteria bacterium]|nr:hypothetical protein [Deltaproteobacteria bacterium]